MSRLAILLTAILVATSAAASDRFAPDNPWFMHFEADCRVDPVPGHCLDSIEMLYATHHRVLPSQVTCDAVSFWRVRDDKLKADPNDWLGVLPWEYGVEAIIFEPGVCSTAIGY